MTDIVSKEKRSWNMSRIRAKNTKPEILVRSFLHKAGFRYRLHLAALPGKPDIVLAKYKTAIFVNGCFWHGHNCSFFRLPSTNVEFWQNKIFKNKGNDLNNIALLVAAGWRVISFWECAVRGKSKIQIAMVLEDLAAMVKSTTLDQQISIPPGFSSINLESVDYL